LIVVDVDLQVAVKGAGDPLRGRDRGEFGGQEIFCASFDEALSV